MLRVISINDEHHNYVWCEASESAPSLRFVTSVACDLSVVESLVTTKHFLRQFT